MAANSMQKEIEIKKYGLTWVLTQVSTHMLGTKHEFSMTGICLGLCGKFTFWT